MIQFLKTHLRIAADFIIMSREFHERTRRASCPPSFDYASLKRYEESVVEAKHLRRILSFTMHVMPWEFTPEEQAFAKNLLAVLVTSSAPALSRVVDDWKWSGSFFPIERIFGELSVQVPEECHDELRRLITSRVQKHNATLE